MEKISNIFCVARNYSAHANELNNEVPLAPIFFMKPAGAVVKLANGLTPAITLPLEQSSVHYEIEMVVQLKTSYQAKLPLEESIGWMGAGIDFTLRDIQADLQKKGLPWLAAKGFKHSAVLTPMIPFVDEENFQNLNFSLKKNQQLVQTGNNQQMIFPLRKLLDYCSEHFGLEKGDLIFAGTPAGVGPVYKGDLLELFVKDKRFGAFTVQSD